MKNNSINGITRVNKTTARKLYNAGKSVLFLPCKLNPDNTFGLGIWENKELDGQYNNFEELCEGYASYNCNSYFGNYIAFYV